MKKGLAVLLAFSTLFGSIAIGYAEDKEWSYVVKEETKDYKALIADDTIERDKFMEEYNAKENRPHFFLNDIEGDESNLQAVNFKGEDCLFFDNNKKYVYGKVPENISADTKYAAVKVTFFDHFTDWVRFSYTRPTGTVKNAMIQKAGTETWRTETILLHDSVFKGAMKHGSDFYLNSYESYQEMMIDYVKDVEYINLDKDAAAVTADGKKKNVLQQGTLFLLSSMGLLDADLVLENVADGKFVEESFKRITGKEINASDTMTVAEMLKAFSGALGVKGENEADWIESGLIRDMNTYVQRWFNIETYKTQQHGMYNIAVGGYDRTLYVDDVVGILYNLLFVRENGESFLAKVCEDETVFDGMAYTNDQNLMYSYYEEKGYRVKETTTVDEVTGETITQFYSPGVNMISTYINERPTVDNKNFIFCAGVSRHYSNGNPIVYNRETGETITVDNRRIPQFGQVLSDDNVMYYTVENEIMAYDIKTGKKEMLWEEPNGAVLQEIPTITNDGNFLCVFWGSVNKSYPDHIGIFDIKNREMKTYLGQKWVDNHFYGASPIFVGHPCINPADETIIQFLHGGGSSVEDRMWFLDTKTNKTWKAPAMTRKFDGSFGEQCVHWNWSYDGTKLYYCRMSTQSLATDHGIVCYDFTNPENGVVQINDSYPYTHATPAANGELIIADTNKMTSDGFYRSEIILYDYVSDYAKLLSWSRIWSSHPCHSHPTFSLDSSMVFFNCANTRDNSVRVGMIEVNEIVEKMRSEGNTKHYTTAKVQLGENPTFTEGIRVRNDVANGSPRPAILNGEECMALESGRTLLVDVDGEYIYSDDNRVMVRFTYFDNGYEPFAMNYNSNLSSEDQRNKNSKTISIPRRNTNKWVTRDVVINNASFRSALSASFDFSVSALSGGETVYMKSIETTALK